MAVGVQSRLALRLLFAAGLFAGTLELAARAVLLYPPAHYVLNTGGPEARKLVSVTAARRISTGARIHIGGVDADPDLGWTLAASAYIAHEGLTTDARRHRVTRPPDRVLAPDAPKVLLIGDSFTLGLELADAQTWAWKLQEQTDADIVNAGVHGYGLDQAVLKFERDGVMERPTFVVLGLDEPLLVRTKLAWDAWAKPWFTLSDAGLELHGVPVPTPQEVMAAAPRSMAVAMWPVLIEHYTRTEGANYSVPLTTALFDRLLSDVRDAGARLVLLRMPITTMASEPMGIPRSMPVYDAWCTNTNVICVDALPAIDAAVAAGEPLVAGVHWSAEVSTRVATELTRALVGGGHLPPRTAAP